MTDIMAATIAFLKTDTGIAAEVGDRIFGGELPTSENEYMPRKVIVLTYAGGIERNRFLPIAEPRIDIWSYGETYHEAARLDRVVYQAFKDLDRKTVADTLLHGAALSGGPNSLRDGETGWHVMMRSIVVTADERSTA